MRKRSKRVDENQAPETAGVVSTDDRQFIGALHRGLQVLRCFQPGDRALGNQELAQRTGLPNSTVSRLTFTLSSLGYLDYLEDIGKYRIGIAVLSLGYACLAGISVRDTARPLMKKLAEMAGGGTVVGLGGRDDLNMIYIAAARSNGVVSLQLDVGSRISLSRSSMGRAYLAGLPAEERAPLLGRIREHSGEREWPKIEDSILRSVEEVQSQGFCMNVGEWQPEVSSVAAPFQSMHADGRLLAFNCGAPSYLLPRELLKNEIGPKLVEMVRQVSALTSHG